MVRVNEPLCTKTGREIFNIQFSVLYNIRSLQSPEKSPMPLAQWNESLFVLAFSSHCSVLVVTWPGLTGCWLMRPIPFKAEISQGWALVSLEPHLENKEPRWECYGVPGLETIIRVLMITSLSFISLSKCSKVSLADGQFEKVKIIRVTGGQGYGR